MFGLVILKKLNAKQVGAFFTYLMPVGLFLRWLVRSAMGALLLLSCIWLYMWHFADIKPWTPDQLMLWVSDLESDVKGALLTALLTVIGFTVAFQTAAEAWKMQALGEIKLRLADEIEMFFGDTSTQIIHLTVYSNAVVNALAVVTKEGVTQNAAFTVEHVLSNTPKFLAARDKLSSIRVDMHGFTSRSMTLLSSLPGAPEWLEDLLSAVEEVAKAMWNPTLPLTEGDRGQRIASFVKFVNTEHFRSLVETCERFRPVINGHSGGLAGTLRSSVIRPNFFTFVYMFKRRRIFEEAFSLLERVKKP